MVALLIGSSICLALITLWVLRLLASIRVCGVDPDWLQTFTVTAYRPMARLLSEEDIHFLRSQPGYRPEMEKWLRRERRRLYRLYLQSLAKDFNRIHLALRMALLTAPEDQPELARALVRQKVRFVMLFLWAHAQLLFHTLGFGKANATPLVTAVEAARKQLQGWLGWLNPEPVRSVSA